MSQLKVVHPDAAGIDIGSEKVFVAVEGQSVRNFATFTASYHELARYLLQHNIKTVAMEATGVYWIALYEILEQYGLDVWLVNPYEVKRVPGRKSDVQDCQWLQQLHSFGLLHRCFIPQESIRKLRAYVRLRDDHIQMGASHILHMEKALELMNIKLHTVISRLTGVSGQRIIQAILNGERNPETLVELCDRQILKHKRQQVLLALEGNYQAEHLFAVQQAYECWRFYQVKIQECDKQIAALLEEMTKELPPPEHPSPAKPSHSHQPEIDNLHTVLLRLTGGNDPSLISGLSDVSFLKVIGETGTDLKRQWPTAKHFTSWMGLAPGKNSSGKSTKRNRKRANTRAGQVFKLAAQSVGTSKHLALGAFYRRLRAKRGPMIANKATARKLATMYYNVLTEGLSYVEEGINRYNQRYTQSVLRSLAKKAKQFNLQLVPLATS